MSLTNRLCQSKSTETFLQTLEMVCTVEVYTVHVRYQVGSRHRFRTGAVNTMWRSSRRSFCRGLCGHAVAAVITGCRRPVLPDGTPGAPPHPRGQALSPRTARCCLLHPTAQRSASGSAPCALCSAPEEKATGLELECKILKASTIPNNNNYMAAILKWSQNGLFRTLNINMCLKSKHLLCISIKATTGNTFTATHPTLCRVPLLHWKHSCCSDTIQHQQKRH